MATDKKLIQVRLTAKLHKELREISKVEKRSISNMVEVILTQAIAIRKSK